MIRVADPYSSYTDPDPEFSKVLDPDPDPEVLRHIFKKIVSSLIFVFFFT
jgi:hypothetical protein